MPLLSIVIINDSAAEYCVNLFKSLQKQKLDKLSTEVIFIDNCSSDDSIIKIKEFHIDTIFSFSEKIEYRGILYNKGIELSIGEYILFVHSDVVMENGLIEGLIDVLKFKYFDWINISQKYVDQNIYGYDHIGIDDSNHDIYYRQIFGWNHNVQKRLDCSEACFTVKRCFIENNPFSEIFKKSFFEYAILINPSTKIYNYEDNYVIHYFIEFHEKIKSYEYDHGIFLSQYFKQLNGYFNYLSTQANCYIDFGNGYNEVDSTTLNASYIDGKVYYFIILNNSRKIKSIRFDPLEGFFCRFKINNIFSDGEYKTIEWTNSSCQVDGWDIFYTIDPIYVFDGNFSEASWIKIEGELDMLQFASINQFIGQIQNELSQTQNELSQTQNELSQTQNELSQTRNELAQMRSSRTWRWGGKIASVVHFFKKHFT